jgi:hypothetical protein
MSTMSVSAANQFIGSKISLTSKSDIRYEGTLYCLDLREATISLAKGELIFRIHFAYFIESTTTYPSPL